MKRFLTKTFLMIIPIVGVILYYIIAIKPHMHGDLGRLGFIAFDDEYESTIDKNIIDSLYVINIDDLSQIDIDSAILTVGDSFSQMGVKGYQNYLAILYPNWKVYNLRPMKFGSQYQIIVDMLIKNKQLPPIVIIESVERYMTGRLCNLRFYEHANIEREISLETIKSHSTIDSNSEFSFAIHCLKNLKISYDKVAKPLRDTQEYIKKNLNIENPVKKLKLSQNLFSCKGSEDELYFYYEDLNNITEKDAKESRLKLDSLLTITEQKGINLIFLAASDKYNLYKDFINNDVYQADGQLSSYEMFNTNNSYLNTKELFYPHIQKGEKDIYKCNDTHWSPKASYYVAKEIERRLKLN